MQQHHPKRHLAKNAPRAGATQNSATQHIANPVAAITHHAIRKMASSNLHSAWCVEPLEQRALLSGVFDISKLPVYHATSGDISDPKNGPLGNAGVHLTQVYTEYKSFIRKGGEPDAFKSKKETLLQYKNGSVAVTVRTRGSMKATTQLLHSLGAELIYRNAPYAAVDAWVPIGLLTTLSTNGMVANLNPAYAPQSFVQGIADNQGDQAQNADSARSTFGVDGSGVKVGVLSDSVNTFEGGLADSQASGDLPKGVQVIADQGGGTDEGRAMLELIHDIAPGASLAFATAGNTQNEMAHNITELVRAGCSVIVDDIGFFDEPFFQGGVIDQAITDAVENHNVVYLSSARNGGFAGFQTNAHFVTDISGRKMLDWDPSDNVDTRMRVTVNGLVPITFGWDEPFNGIVGAAKVDLDIEFIDPATGIVVASGLDANLVTSNPEEVIDVPPGTYDIQVSVVDKATPKTPLPSIIRLASSNGAINLQNITNPEYPLQRITTSGHNAGRDTISIGAVPWYLAAPFNSSEQVTNDDFSSAGPVKYVFKQNGDPLKSPVTILKPDVSGIDGVNTSFFGEDITQDTDKLPNFFGTSAAAPNVAAVVALMRELVPEATPTEIQQALITSAKTNPLNGQLGGKFDRQAGFGLIDSLLALHQISPETVVADIGRVVPDTVDRGVDSITIRFSEPVVGFSLDDLMLTRGKDSAINLLDDPDVSLNTKNHQTFTLAGLTNVTSTRGTYFLRFNPVGVLDRLTRTHPALNGATSFVVSGKPTGFAVIPVSASEIDLDFVDNTKNEAGFEIQRATNASFTKNVRTFHTGANVSHFHDTTGLEPTTQYFYRVRATVKDAAPNPFTNAISVFTLSANENVADNRSEATVVKGAWTLVNDTDNAIGGDYLKATAKGTKSVTFTPRLTAGGTYFLYVRSIAAKSNATNVPVDIIVDGDVKKTFIVNERVNTGYIQLGTFKFAKGDITSVRIRNTGVDGNVVADAVRFQRTSGSAAGIKVTASGVGNLFSDQSVKKPDDSVLN